MDVPYKVVPIETWPGEVTTNRGWSRFRSSLGDTLRLLEKELAAIGATDVIIQMAVKPHHIRQDGRLRANAPAPDHPGVILTFDARHGPVSMPCDTYNRGRDNLRAIALSLGALRAVDRYGVSKRGEQYRGWGKLPPAGGSSAKMDARTAAEIMVDVEQLDGDPEYLLIDHDAVTNTYRNAAKEAHPDRHGGDTARFQLLTEAKAVLDEHHRVPR